MEKEKENVYNEILRKRNHLKELVGQQVAFRNLVERNVDGCEGEEAGASSSSRGRRMKKSDIDNLVRGMYGQ